MLIDFLIAFLLISIILRGRQTGLILQLCAAIGFIAGLFLGAFLQPQAMAYADTTLSRALLSLIVTLGCALILMSLGERIGISLKSRLQQLMPLNRADAALGSVAGGITLLAAIWLITPVLLSLPSPGLQQSLQRSSIISSLNRSLPSAPEFISRIDRIINPNGFPDVFADLERQPLAPDTPLPSLGDLRPAVESTRASIVKLEGRGCGGVVTGSGFVAAEDVIVTNAHVVAGVPRPTVVDTNGRHSATVIGFDPDLDIAVLRITSGELAGQPLDIDTGDVETGTASVTVGFPGGGGFKASPSTVLDQFTARGRDIYGRGISQRSVLELRADIVAGNSGGPLLDVDGQVIGLIFAESTSYEDIGYALTTDQVAANLQQALAANQTVASGACAG